MKQKTICIIGFGATGISFLRQLLEEIKNGEVKNPPRIVIYNSNKNPARGLAYSNKSPHYRLNMRSSTMSIWPENPMDFVDYLKKVRGMEDVPEYASRYLFGDYLEHAWKVAQELAKEMKIPIEYNEEKIETVTPNKDGTFTIGSSEEESINVEYAVMCLGNLPPETYRELRGEEGYLHNFYGKLKAAAVEGKTKAVILGCSLSAVDALLHLVKECKFEGEVTLVSRKGILPSVQVPKMPAVKNITPEELPPGNLESLEEFALFVLKNIGSKLTIKDLIEWSENGNRNKSAIEQIRTSIKLAETNKAFAWQAPLLALSRGMPLLWQKLPIRERERFLWNFNTQWAAFRFSMPLPTAKKLVDLLESQNITISSGVESVVSRGEGKFEVKTKDAEFEADLVINATGSGLDAQKSNDPLLRFLLEQKIGHPHSCGGFWVSEDTCEILDENRKPIENLHLMGSLTRGVFLYANALEMNALQAQEVSKSIFSKL